MVTVAESSSVAFVFRAIQIQCANVAEFSSGHVMYKVADIGRSRPGAVHHACTSSSLRPTGQEAFHLACCIYSSGTEHVCARSSSFS